jgi:hypothetical protein
MDPSSPECSDTTIVFADVPFPVELPNVAALAFRHEEGSYLAGAAAALTSTTGVIGFVGGVEPIVEGFLDGYAAGARAVDPAIEIVGVWTDSFNEPALGWAAAQQILDAGADVIYHAAGFTGEGVLEAVRLANEEGDEPIWFIGVDVDEAITASPNSRPYVLASMVKRVDNAVVDAIGASLRDELTPGLHTYGLAERGVDLTTTGDHLWGHSAEIERLRQRIVDGSVAIPPWTDSGVTILPLESPTATHSGRVTLAGEQCTYSGPTGLTEGDVLGVTAEGPTQAGLLLFQQEDDPPSEPFALDEPLPGIEPPGVVLGEPDVTAPLIAGTWMVGCFTDGTVYPAGTLSVTVGR